ncbi:MAG TPA: PAS domain S-box protein, partial [Thermoplasmata archaeon]|nr:PAS domain S-box protein [Thermoplasmata archaeon]
MGGRPFHVYKPGASFRLLSTGGAGRPHKERAAMTAPNAPEPKELVTSRAKGPAPKPKWRTRVSARAIGLWLVVGGLSALFAIIAVAVALAQIRTFSPTTLGVALLFLAPIGGAIAAIVLYARSMGRATLGRTQAVEAARASESGFRTVAATMADGILTIDERSRIQYMNDAAAKLFGYSQDELLGHELTEVMPERFRPRHLTAFRRYLETGEKHVKWQGIEFSGRHKGGHEIPIEVSLGEYSAGGRRLFIGVVRDVTERTRAREAQ